METENALIQWESNESIQQRIKKMLEIQQYVMKKDIDYGIIPGCKKPSLYKPGMELLMVTFGLSDETIIEDLSDENIIRYRITTRITHMATGMYLGCGVGEASSDQEKYKWRKAICDEEYDDAGLDQKREKWFKADRYNKKPYKVKQIRTQPADVANTVLKMAKKSSKIDGVMSVTAASRIYTQDIQDMSKELQDMINDEGRPQSTKPDITQETTEKKTNTSKSGTERQVPTQEETDSLRLISEKQGYFLIAKMKTCGVDEQSLLNYLKIPSVFYVTWNKKVNTCMDKLLKTIQDKPKFFDKYKAESEKKEEKPVEDSNDAPVVFSHDDFLKAARTCAGVAGLITDEAINALLADKKIVDCKLDDVAPEKQQVVIDFLVWLKDNREQK